MKTEVTYYRKGDKGWHEKRAQYITGTELAALFGLNKYSSPRKVFEQKIKPDFQDNVFTRMGRILEPAVLNFANEVLKEQGKFFADDGNMVYACDEHGISATPDAYIGPDLSRILALLELKTTSIKNATLWQNEPPLNYLVQLAAQSMLAKVPDSFLVVMVPQYPDLPGLVFKQKHEHGINELVTSEVSRFWKHFTETPEKQYRVDKDKSKELVRLLLKNLTIVHNSVKELEPPKFEINWD